MKSRGTPAESRVVQMKTLHTNCDATESRLAAMLLDPVAAPARVQSNVAECEDCSRELDELRATLALLDEWQAPEPSPYFTTRLNARLREEREKAPAGWLGRLTARVQAGLGLGQAAHVRPLAAMALTVLLLIGGGAYLNLANGDLIVQPANQTAVVHDLQTLDNNAQLLDQLETISDSNSNGD